MPYMAEEDVPVGGDRTLNTTLLVVGLLAVLVWFKGGGRRNVW